MTDTAFGDEPPTDGAPDPLRPAFEAVSAATDPRGKLDALKRAAADLAIPIRHGMLDRYEIEERLIDLADSHGLVAELTSGVVELVIANALNTPALPIEPSPIERGNGHTADDPPPPRGPDDYGSEAPPPKQSTGPLPPLTIEDWLARDLPEPDFIMGDWLTTTTRGLLVAPTGLGKTNFAMALGMHIAAGTDFLHWRARRPSRVLYIDGEMSRRLLRQRIADAVRRLGEKPSGFHAFSHEDIEVFPPLNTQGGQACVDGLIKVIGGVDFVVFDAIMCLLAGDMKDGESWAQVMPWVRSLTKQKIGQLWVHHTGHDESRSYGDKTKEWQLDTVLHMDPVENADTDVNFNLEFRKARERTPATRADFQTTRIALLGDTWRSDVAGGARKGHISPVGLKFLSALQNVLAGGAELHAGRRSTTLALWRGECVRMGLIDPDKPKSASALFSKHRRELIAENHVVCDNEFAWLSP
jgi:AAA domain